MKMLMIMGMIDMMISMIMMTMASIFSKKTFIDREKNLHLNMNLILLIHHVSPSHYNSF